jgi:hypothetical protein
MMEDRRARLRLEVVCRAAKSELRAKGKRGSSNSKLDPVQISSSSLCGIITSLLTPSADEDSWGGFNMPDNENEFVRVTIEEFVAQGLGGLCLTCVRTGQDHKSHSG